MCQTKITVRGIMMLELRARIKTIADGLGVCGTVQSMRDGSVLVVCEAERVEIEEMVRQIRSGTKPAIIISMLVEEGPPATGMEGFEVIRGDFTEEMLFVIAAGTQMNVGMLARLNEPKREPEPDKRDPGGDGAGPGRSGAGPDLNEECKVHGQQAGRITRERHSKP